MCLNIIEISGPCREFTGQYFCIRLCTLGSVVGGAAFVVARDLATTETLSTTAVLIRLLALPLFAALSSFLSIPFGFIPALFACLLYWLLLSRFTFRNPSASIRAALGALVGALASGSFGALLFSVGAAPDSYPICAKVSAWIVAGIAGGAISALSAGNGTYEATFKQ